MHNFEQAFRWALLSAERDHAPAQFQLGQMYRQALGIAQDYNEAVKWYRLSADQGNAAAQCNLGFMYLKGHGVPKDIDQSKIWYQLAAKNGHEGAKKQINYFRNTPQIQKVNDYCCWRCGARFQDMMRHTLHEKNCPVLFSTPPAIYSRSTYVYVELTPEQEIENSRKVRRSERAVPAQFPSIFCPKCKGDGGATGNCPTCGGSGFPP